MPVATSMCTTNVFAFYYTHMHTTVQVYSQMLTATLLASMDTQQSIVLDLHLFAPLGTQNLIAETELTAQLYTFWRQRFINSSSIYFLDTFNKFSLFFQISDSFAPGNTKTGKILKFV